MNEFSRSGTIVDIHRKTLFPGTVYVQNGVIIKIKREPQTKSTTFILPGFIDAHIHIESSMLVPSEFARLASVHGTVATISDPHEIANVCGIPGIRYMIENGQKVPFYFGIPSCVPAIQFETSGATITTQDVEILFREEGLKFLGEMMNFPGVIAQDPLVIVDFLLFLKEEDS